MARSKAPTSKAAIVFEGPPEAVEALVPLDPQRRRDIRVSVADEDGWTPVRALTAAAGQQTLVRLVLPPDTPVNEVGAVVDAGDDHFDAIIRTTGQAELICSPNSVDVVVADGAPATATLNVVNVGNVPVDIPDISVFGVLLEGSLDAAIGTALMSSEGGVDRLGRAADTLAERHGGLARVSIDSGAGRLEPGAATVVQAHIRLGEHASSTHRYAGTWVLATLRIPVSIRTQPKQRPSSTPRRRTKKGSAG